MAEEGLVAGAEVVEPGLAVGGEGEPVLRALAVAREAHVAVAAVRRQGVALGRPEGPLPRRGDQLDHRAWVMLPSRCAGLDEVVARVDVAVVLEGEGVAAGLLEDAERRGDAQPDARAVSKWLTKTSPTSRTTHSSNTAVRKRAPGLGVDRAVGDRVPLLEPGLVVALDDRDELDVAQPELVAEEPVDLERVVLVGGVDRAQDVRLDAMAAQEPSKPAITLSKVGSPRLSTRYASCIARAARRC